MSAWDDAQTDPVKEIEAAIFEEMGSASNSDPRSPWADLALALCQRAAAAESSLASAREEARGLREALNGATAVWFGTQLYPAFSGEKNRRMDAAMERARRALSPSPAPEAPADALSRIAAELNAIVERERAARPKVDRSGDDAFDYVWSAAARVRHALRYLRPAPAASADTREEG
jgi:hypothetical protein